MKLKERWADLMSSNLKVFGVESLSQEQLDRRLEVVLIESGLMRLGVGSKTRYHYLSFFYKPGGFFELKAYPAISINNVVSIDTLHLAGPSLVLKIGKNDTEISWLLKGEMPTSNADFETWITEDPRGWGVKIPKIIQEFLDSLPMYIVKEEKPEKPW